ncbi:MAG: Na+:solute symporter [Bacteroidia bacterium]|nr:Na+:solute symporter [Bacteroidia bacterium]
MFQQIDWIILITYLLLALIVGILMTRKAGKGLEAYFVADRSLPWWWLGISMIATTFAADTPLAVTGITANEGVAGNWLWWSWAITYITVAIFFASRWRKSNVLTDVEFIEMRYDGAAARFLRGFKSVYFGIVVNCFILGWVMTAMTRIADPFISWEMILGSDVYSNVSNWFPQFLLFKENLNTTITVIAITLIVMVYSTLGGIRGVVITDLFQFAIAIVTAIIFAFTAVDFVGGLDGLYSKMDTLYGPEKAEFYTDFFPSLKNPLLPIYIFLIYVFVQWWARYDSDGTGYLAQRINSASSAKDAMKGSLLFAIAFVALRSWPWILIGLVSLVVFPVGMPELWPEAFALPVEDDKIIREAAYPVLMKMILPAGLLGLTFTSLVAAFMSTVDTHLNWGSSYLLNDLYKRYIKPDAGEKHLVKVSRITVVLITIIAILVSSQITTIASAWKFFWNMASGLGVAQLMRWMWWRANAWTEISAMIGALILTVAMAYGFPDQNPTIQLAIISLCSFIIAILFTYLTPSVNHAQLSAFSKKLKPFGFWKGYQTDSSIWKRSVLNWVMAIVCCYSALFCIGYALKMEWIKTIVLFLFFVFTFHMIVKKMSLED